MSLHTPTPLKFHNEARKKILDGANKIYEAVRMSMGPQGGNALIYGLYSRPYRITNDGYTIAEVIEIKDPHEKLGAEAFKDAAKRTNLLAGDGTSATCVIAGNLLNSIIPEIQKRESTAEFERAFAKKEGGRGVMDIKKHLFEMRDLAVSLLKEASKPIKTQKELEKVAVISVENEALGKTIAEMSWKVGNGGYVDVLEGFKGDIETELIEGARFPAKIPAKVFVNKLERYEMEAVDAAVLLTNYTVDKQVMATFLGKIQNLQKLIIFAPDFKDSALVTMAQINGKNNDLIYAPVKVPSLKTVQFEDVEVFTGARFINKDRGDKPENVSNADLGFLSKLIVKDADLREDCIALGGKGTQKRTLKELDVKMMVDETSVDQRIRQLKEQLKETREEGQKHLLQRRIAGLSSAVGVIRVSASSEGETYYLKKKIEDAVYACKAAMEEGYVRGGGLALKEIADKLPEGNMLSNALRAPYEQIQENSE